MSKLQNLSEKVLAVFEKEFGNEMGIEDFDLVRLTLGMTLSGVHSTMLATARGRDIEIQQRTAGICFDSVKRLMDCMQRDFENFNIKAKIETGVIVDDNGVPTMVKDTDLM